MLKKLMFFGLLFSLNLPIGAMEEAPRQQMQEDAKPLKQDPFRKAIEVAVENNNLEPLRELLLAGADANRMIECLKGRVPVILFAVSLFDVNENSKVIKEMVNLLLAYGADVNIKGPWGQTSLNLAAERGHVHMVEFLSNAGALIDMQDARGGTPLMVAAQNGHLDVVHTLLRHKAQPNIQAAGVNNATALFLAARCGHSQVVQALLQDDAQIDLTLRTGAIPLMAAAHEGHKDVVELLLKNGATVNAQAAGAANRTALFLAVESNHVEIADLLIKYGADVDLAMDNGITPLMAVAREQRIELLELLLRHNANIDAQAQGANNMSALMFATLANKENSVRALLNANADVSLRNADHGDTVFCIGARHGHQAMVRRFLTHIPVRDCEAIRNCFIGLLALNRICHEADEDIENSEASAGKLPVLPLEMRRIIAIQLFKCLVDDQRPRITELLVFRNNNNQTAGEIASAAALELRADALDQPEERACQEALAQNYDNIAHLLDVNNLEARLERRKIVWNKIVGILLNNRN